MYPDTARVVLSSFLFVFVLLFQVIRFQNILRPDQLAIRKVLSLRDNDKIRSYFNGVLSVGMCSWVMAWNSGLSLQFRSPRGKGGDSQIESGTNVISELAPWFSW